VFLPTTNRIFHGFSRMRRGPSSNIGTPIQEIGPVKNANRLAAVNLEFQGRKLKVGVLTTEALKQLRVIVTAGESIVFEKTRDFQPSQPFIETVELSTDCPPPAVLLRVLSSDGREIIRFRPEEARSAPLPEPATEPASPREIATIEELYVTGLHLEQYRHATRFPEAYWEEGLRRDAYDVRCNNAMGLLCLRRGRLQDAETYFRRAIARLTDRNPNPRDGEPFYNLGLALKYQEQTEDAYTAFYKSVWNAEWQSAGCYALATIDSGRGDFERALEHLDNSLAVNRAHLKARNLKSAILRQMGRNKEALDLVRDTRAFDPLDLWSENELLTLTSGSDSSDSRPTACAHTHRSPCHDHSTPTAGMPGPRGAAGRAAAASGRDEDHARAGLGGGGPGRADVGQREGAVRDLDRAVGDELQVARDLRLDLRGGHRARAAAGDGQLPAAHAIHSADRHAAGHHRPDAPHGPLTPLAELRHRGCLFGIAMAIPNRHPRSGLLTPGVRVSGVTWAKGPGWTRPDAASSRRADALD